MATSATPVLVRGNGLQFTGLEWAVPGPAPVPLVLCLHGFPQHCTSWTAVAERLAAAGIRTVALDQRGYSPGARPPEVAAYGMVHLVADVLAMIDSLGGPLHLVGHDWGGVVGWQVAARRPDLVLSWTAVSTPHQLAINEQVAASAAERDRFAYIRALRDPRAEQQLADGGWWRFTEFYGGRVSPERVGADVAFFQEPGVLTAALNWYRAMTRYDADGLGPVGVPTSFVWGSADRAFSPAMAAGSERFVTGSYRFLPLDGAAHWLPDEAPDALAGAIAERVLDG
jgi:pimeloyl-ACP methyl ester carboxylesterase